MSRWAAALVGSLSLLTSAVACGEDSPTKDRNDDAEADSFALSVKTESGQRVEFPKYAITCEPQFYDGATPNGEIIEVATPVDDFDPRRPKYFFIQAVVADVEDGASYDFGFDFGFVYDDPSGADIVVGVGKGEPFTGAQELSEGTLTIHSASCSPEPSIDLEVEGTLANEYETEGSIDIDGRINIGG